MTIATVIFCSLDKHRHVVRFDCESLPLLRERLADLIGEAVIDEDTAMLVWRQACFLANEVPCAPPANAKPVA